MTFNRVPTTADNPLLGAGSRPAFSRIGPDHVVPAIDQILADSRRAIAELLEHEGPHDWESLGQPMEDLEDRLSRAWSPVAHLHAVADCPELRDAFNACLPKLSDYATELGQNERLFRGYRSMAEAESFDRLSQARRKAITNALRDFRLAGVDLPESDKARFKSISKRLSELSSRFGENVLDATQGWKKHITDESRLAGLPDTVLALAGDNAAREELTGWLFTLEAPSYIPVMSYADDRELRREMYDASTTRASDLGPNAKRWDNTDIIAEVLRLRQEKARLLGFTSYAEYSLATKMARSPEEVLEFLNDLAARTKPVAETELAELRGFAREKHGADPIEVWDIPYYSEKLRQHRFSITQEALRPFFPAPRVLQGLFAVVNRLFGLEIGETRGVDTWHPDVQFFTVHDAQGKVRGHFYIDLFSRPHKRGGAWMDECVVRKRRGSDLQDPVAYLTCNFTPPVGDDPALLTHDEVTTLFHEFGHGLHHMLTQVDDPSVAGINGVEWDAVELPSQIMENWCWEREALAVISGHFQTGEPLPDDQFEKLVSARNFQAGLRMIRQIEFALFDFRLHIDTAPGPRSVGQTLEAVRREVAVVHPPAFNRFAHSFTHVFGGGYAAGYYSYLWAEVLSSDAFARFEENGVFDRTTGLEFMRAVLEQGGSREAMELFVEFRGREPVIEPLLRHSGIISEVSPEILT